MAVPEFSAFFLPVLICVNKQTACSLSDLRAFSAEYFHLSEKDLAEKVKSGKKRRLDDRVQWAKTYLVNAGLLSSPRRGFAEITEVGKKLLDTKPKTITLEDLEKFPDFIKFHTSARNKKRPPFPEENGNGYISTEVQTPSEQIEEILDGINMTLSKELLDAIHKARAQAFEQLVLDVIRSMNYGIDGETTRYVKDGGIDGIIREDKLGLNEIYLQAKLWDGNVGSPDIQRFIGALDMHKVQNGIFITQSDFTQGAKDAAAKSSRRIILINGKDLVGYMIKYGVGVQVCQTYELKKIDFDYFESIS